MREGEMSKYLKSGWNSKDRRRNRDFKKKKGRGQAGSRPGCLKNGGAICCSCFMFQQPLKGEIF